jgi:hypothetical protein
MSRGWLVIPKIKMNTISPKWVYRLGEGRGVSLEI